jgi:hypothetical protein
MTTSQNIVSLTIQEIYYSLQKAVKTAFKDYYDCKEDFTMEYAKVDLIGEELDAYLVAFRNINIEAILSPENIAIARIFGKHHFSPNQLDLNFHLVLGMIRIYDFDSFLQGGWPKDENGITHFN